MPFRLMPFRQGTKVGKTPFTGLLFCIVGTTLFWMNSVAAQEAVENLGKLRPELPNFIPQDDKKPFELPKTSLSKTAPSQTTGSRSHAQTFLLSSAEFVGNRIFSDLELNQVIAEHIGKGITASDLEEMRVALTQFYIARGYINSGVLLPSQNVENGISLNGIKDLPALQMENEPGSGVY